MFLRYRPNLHEAPSVVRWTLYSIPAINAIAVRKHQSAAEHKLGAAHSIVAARRPSPPSRVPRVPRGAARSAPHPVSQHRVCRGRHRDHQAPRRAVRSGAAHSIVLRGGRRRRRKHKSAAPSNVLSAASSIAISHLSWPPPRPPSAALSSNLSPRPALLPRDGRCRRRIH